jgi:serine/threonine protein phosphatase 1
MGRRWVIGDIHGAHKALIQCLERSAFDLQNDSLICLGDLCDRWPDVNKVFDTLLQVKSRVLLLGNHDLWALEWFTKGNAPGIWLDQGGDITMSAYRQGIPESHIAMLKEALLYFELDNKVFVHAGFNPNMPIQGQAREVLLWDRSLIKSALRHKQNGDEIHLTPYEEVYIGHTPAINFGTTSPVKACEIYLLDTGAGWPEGKLSIMDIDSKEFYQSNLINTLYPG